MASFDSVLSAVDESIWTYLVVWVVLGVGLYLSVRLSFFPLLNLFHGAKVITRGTRSGDGISSFEAFATSMASRVGVGNLTGVALALQMGGRGALFWMWAAALLGCSTAFTETTLAQLYKVPDEEGEYSFRGGGAYYINRGLRSRTGAYTFAITLTISTFITTTQSNTVAQSLSHHNIPTYITGTLLVLSSGLVIVGGMKRIAKFAKLVVPVMAVGYVLLTVVVVVVRYNKIIPALGSIFSAAFTDYDSRSPLVGFVVGIQRGVFSSEAGLGTAGHAAALASPNPPHPCTQAVMSAFGVFLDTIVICTCTGLLILLSGVEIEGQVDGIKLTQRAVESVVGSWGGVFISVVSCFFGFTTIVALFVYGHSNIKFLGGNRVTVFLYQFVYLSVVFLGAMASTTAAWAAADVLLALICLVNLTALVMLVPKLTDLVRDYGVQLNHRQSSFNQLEEDGEEEEGSAKLPASEPEITFERTEYYFLETSMHPEVWKGDTL